MAMLIQRVKSIPVQYIKKVVSPLWWVRKALIYFDRKKMAKESDRILLLLTKMYQGQYQGLLEYRDARLSQILKYTYEHSPYYRKLFEKIHLNPKDWSNFERLPLLDKATIRSHWNNLISDEINNLNFYIMNTGGSTGEPLEFPVSHHVDGVHQEFLYRVIGYEPGDKIVAFDGSSVPAELRKNRIYWVTNGPGNDIPYGRLSYSSLYLTAETIPFYIKHILDTTPSILRGYPSFISDIADYILKNNITIPFHIKGVELTAENAYDWQIENIKKAFNTSIFFQYGQSEVCVFGYTVDETYEYFCSPFYGLTEVLNSEGVQVKKGEIGEIVATSFYNFALPFIRYQTGDLAVFNGDENGIVRLGKIIGRTQDFIYTQRNERVALTALIFGQHYHAFRNIRKWQIVQDIPGKVTIKIVKGEGFSHEDEEEIRGKFRSICDIETNFEFVDSIQLTKRGKFKFLVQNIKL